MLGIIQFPYLVLEHWDKQICCGLVVLVMYVLDPVAGDGSLVSHLSPLLPAQRMLTYIMSMLSSLFLYEKCVCFKEAPLFVEYQTREFF